ncbi:hypothetical protein F2Q68_00004267 [Brassica cretica]|uniref:Uncharacterized protein n=1 Tax=Brassica cretica TaxID=69181 RepID=A0A8S9J5U5_BRACR|nr:hypothetical protein F2Q68_00004267 [Brassica cretica]
MTYTQTFRMCSELTVSLSVFNSLVMHLNEKLVTSCDEPKVVVATNINPKLVGGDSKHNSFVLLIMPSVNSVKRSPCTGVSIRGYTTEINIPSEPLADATNTGEEEPRIKEEGNSAKKMYAKTKSSTPKRKKNRTPKSERTSRSFLRWDQDKTRLDGRHAVRILIWKQDMRRLHEGHAMRMIHLCGGKSKK